MIIYIIYIYIYIWGLPISSGEGILKEGADGPPSSRRPGWEPAGPWADARGQRTAQGQPFRPHMAWVSERSKLERFFARSPALTFNEPDRARPELAGRILHVILLEGLHKKSGSSALSGARVAREASEGRPLKLGCAPSRRARLLGKCIWGLKCLDRPPLPKTYSRERPIHKKSWFY